jgi:hypothetical protein
LAHLLPAMEATVKQSTLIEHVDVAQPESLS